MARCILFPGVFQSNTSLPSYQFVHYIVESHETTLVVNRTLGEEFEEITSKAENVHEFEGSAVLYPFFSLWMFFRYVVAGEQFDLVASGQNCFATPPAAIVSTVWRRKWILLGWDIPEGRTRVVDAFSSRITERLFHRFNYGVMMLSYRFADVTILSDDSSVLDTADDSIIVAPSGVDRTLVESKSATISTDGESGRTEFVYVGHMHYHRGVDLVLKAARQLQSPARLTLIGHGPNTAPSKDQEKLRESLGMPFSEAIDFDNEHVECEYLGPMDHADVIEQLLRSDVGICILPYERGLPHFHKAYALKTFEYMSCSLAVLSSQTRASVDVLEDNRQFVENTVEGIRDGMELYCSNDELVSEIGAANHARSEQYGWSTVRENIHKKLTQLWGEWYE